jgi:hypothetical protein
MKNEKGSRRTVWLFRTAVVALLVLLFSYVKFNPVRMPPELLGTWKTTNALYADRSLEFGGNYISFLTGGGTEYTGFVDTIEAISEKGKTLYTISYLVDGTRNQTSFYYDASSGGTIQFKNQQHTVWKKESGS